MKRNSMRLIDAVPVVRCKNCKHYNTIGCSKGFGWCENIDRGTSDNFYCAEAAVEMGGARPPEGGIRKIGKEILIWGHRDVYKSRK